MICWSKGEVGKTNSQQREKTYDDCPCRQGGDMVVMVLGCISHGAGEVEVATKVVEERREMVIPGKKIGRMIFCQV